MQLEARSLLKELYSAKNTKHLHETLSKSNVIFTTVTMTMTVLWNKRDGIIIMALCQHNKNLTLYDNTF